MKSAIVAALAAGVSAGVYQAPPYEAPYETPSSTYATPTSIPYEPIPYKAPHPTYGTGSSPYGGGYVAPTGSVSYTTEVVTSYTTYCPSATQITHGGKTYTVTSATTLTITDCPCTISYPVHHYTTSTCTTSTVETTTPCPTSSYPPHGPPVSTPYGGKPPAVSSPPPYGGSPNGANAVAPGLAALLGLVAYIL